MRRLFSRERLPYVLLAFVCLVISLAAGWTSYAERINDNFYDLFFHQRGPRPPAEGIIIVAIDDATLAKYGALPLNRSIVARAIRTIQQAHPRAIAVDLLLTDVSTPESDHDLQSALAGEPRPVLAAALEAERGDKWLLPRPEFMAAAGGIGHVHADPDGDGVNRRVVLAKQADRQRYWALGLEAYRKMLGAASEPITERNSGLEVAGEGGKHVVVPADSKSKRAMLINYAGREDSFPRIGFAALLDNAALAARLRDKCVLIGVTAQGAGDSLFTPFSNGVGTPGVEIHANILHTLLTQNYLLPADELYVALTVVLIALATAVALACLHGVLLAAGLAAIGAAVITGPYWLFLKGHVWPAFTLLIPFGTTLAVCGIYQLLWARKEFTKSEARRRRSQQQFEMATHEMRTPLTAIQASSELLSRYPLGEEKRKEMVGLIFEESQRLGKLVERFLRVERLSAGEIELRLTKVNVSSLLAETVRRVQTVADRKGIQLIYEGSADIEIDADRELLEFAVSNLITNAVKYSPSGTSVRVALESSGDRVQIHIADSGPGMSEQESRRIFERFYRTESARQSDAPGFGLGLAIAREIAVHHGGEMQLATRPGSGSRFTISLPAAAPAGRKAGR